MRAFIKRHAEVVKLMSWFASVMVGLVVLGIADSGIQGVQTWDLAPLQFWMGLKAYALALMGFGTPTFFIKLMIWVDREPELAFSN